MMADAVVAGVVLAWVLFVVLVWRLTRPHTGHHTIGGTQQAADEAWCSDFDEAWSQFIGSMNLDAEVMPLDRPRRSLPLVTEARELTDDEWLASLHEPGQLDGQTEPVNRVSAGQISLVEGQPPVAATRWLGRSDGGVARPVQRAAVVWPFPEPGSFLTYMDASGTLQMLDPPAEFGQTVTLDRFDSGPGEGDSAHSLSGEPPSPALADYVSPAWWQQLALETRAWMRQQDQDCAAFIAQLRAVAA